MVSIRTEIEAFCFVLNAVFAFVLTWYERVVSRVVVTECWLGTCQPAVLRCFVLLGAICMSEAVCVMYESGHIWCFVTVVQFH